MTTQMEEKMYKTSTAEILRCHQTQIHCYCLTLEDAFSPLVLKPAHLKEQ